MSSNVERSRFNVAISVINESRGQFIHRSTRFQGRRWEKGPGTYGPGTYGPGTYGWDAKNDDTAAVRSRYEMV